MEKAMPDATSEGFFKTRGGARFGWSGGFFVFEEKMALRGEDRG